ncbi:uncharacterized protein LOC104910080 isoform X7 [Meleagris gallopavo]|uniref:uncharacterized protein LOC104910080 isoform X7 n=1 Tax=Meleagris gallopavo TaxID=9103 RepID=UPI000549A62F|nr:uncharacterized protein LOC104910080 isoform X7 [Meleagris gallopavo]
MTPTTMYDMHELRRAVKNLTAPLMMTLYLHIFHVLKSPRVPHNAKCVRNEPTCSAERLCKSMKMASAGPVVHELPSLGNSPVWLEGKRQELNVKTTQLSARNDLILESVFDVLQENEIHGLKREVPLLMQRGHLRVTVGKAGRTAGFLHSFPPQSLPRCSCSPIFLLATAGLSWGHVVIRLLEKIWPTAFTVWHISKKVSPSREVSSAPKEFAVLLA